ncbi:hypothetical protein [Devosia sp. SD17-2]|uniref:hypothetical protein n=1 Tax=Devosia sp. SD17-2 TaxID=2976459 RepID=UPI0031F2FB00
MTGGYTITHQTPAVEDYLRLRVAAGLSPKTIEQAELGLPKSWFAAGDAGRSGHRHGPDHRRWRHRIPDR